MILNKYKKTDLILVYSYAEPVKSFQSEARHVIKLVEL